METSTSERSDKDLWPVDGSDNPNNVSLPLRNADLAGPSSIRAKRWTSRVNSLPLVGRTVRGIRWMLGPSTPIPASEIPKPQPSLTISFTAHRHARSIPLDPRLHHHTRKRRYRWALYPMLILWATMFVLLIRQQYYIPGPTLIGCTSSVYPSWPPDACGVNGTGCADDLESGIYRCLGGCLDVTLGNPRWVGGEQVDGVPFVIGGNEDRYRADSWVCASAIHSGLIDRRLGGCVSLQPLPFQPPQSNFEGSKSHGVQSTSFLPDYPGAYELSPGPSGGCMDLHPIITGVNAFYLLFVTLLLSPSPVVLYFILVILGYAQIVLISNPPYTPPYWETVFGRFIPVAFAAYFFWKVAFRTTLTAFKDMPIEVALWQGLGYWIGIESSTIFSKLPIQRLGYGKLSGSGVITLIVIIVIVGLVVLIQAWQMRKYGLLQYYLVRYLPLAPILIVLAFIPDYTLRLHHYLLATAAIPVLGLPNRVSLFGQAFALGLFLDGAGRWGMASILEFTASLIGDAVAGTGVPTFTPNTSSAESIAWFPLTPEFLESGYNGVSVIIDDILRAENVTNSNYTFGAWNLTGGIDHFFRLAFMVNGTTQDYTDPITLFANRTWVGTA